MYSYKNHFPTEVRFAPKYLLKKIGAERDDNTLQFIKLKKKKK